MAKTSTWIPITAFVFLLLMITSASATTDTSDGVLPTRNNFVSNHLLTQKLDSSPGVTAKIVNELHEVQNAHNEQKSSELEAVQHESSVLPTRNNSMSNHLLTQKLDSSPGVTAKTVNELHEVQNAHNEQKSSELEAVQHESRELPKLALSNGLVALKRNSGQNLNKKNENIDNKVRTMHLQYQKDEQLHQKLEYTPTLSPQISVTQNDERKKINFGELYKFRHLESQSQASGTRCSSDSLPSHNACSGTCQPQCSLQQLHKKGHNAAIDSMKVTPSPSLASISCLHSKVDCQPKEHHILDIPPACSTRSNLDDHPRQTDSFSIRWLTPRQCYWYSVTIHIIALMLKYVVWNRHRQNSGRDPLLLFFRVFVLALAVLLGLLIFISPSHNSTIRRVEFVLTFYGIVHCMVATVLAALEEPVAKPLETFGVFLSSVSLLVQVIEGFWASLSKKEPHGHRE